MKKRIYLGLHAVKNITPNHMPTTPNNATPRPQLHWCGNQEQNLILFVFRGLYGSHNKYLNNSKNINNYKQICYLMGSSVL
jgi:hypothetical protein